MDGHRPRGDRFVDRFRSHLPEGRNFRGVRHGIRISVAHHAILLKNFVTHLGAERWPLWFLGPDLSRSNQEKTEDQSRMQPQREASIHGGILFLRSRTARVVRRKRGPNTSAA